MHSMSFYAAFMTIALMVAAAATTGSTQSVLLIVAACSGVALVLDTVVQNAGDRARRRALAGRATGGTWRR